MSELINDLVDKTAAMVPGVYTVEYESGKKGVEFNEEALNRFVELIVRECANAFETEVDTWTQMSPYQGSIKRQGTKAIKKHFGDE